MNESFICEHCRKSVEQHPEWSARNHCPYCLYSKHLDEEFPWDRESNCLWLMTPIDIDYKKNKGNMIQHKCERCQKVMLNKIAPDDRFLDFVKLRNKNI
jgi:hypothetical protein